MYTRWATITIFGCHLASAVEFIHPAAPLITGNIAARQQAQCPEATQTECPDGTGCCPSGAACTYIMGQPRCAVACNGGPSCPGGGCCQFGYACDITEDLCHLVSTGFPMPTLSSFNPGGPILTTESSSPVQSWPTPTSSWGAGGSASSSAGGGEMSSTAAQMSSSAAATSTQGSPTESSMGSSSAGVAAPTPTPGMAGSLSVEGNSWMAWVFAWAVGLPLLA